MTKVFGLLYFSTRLRRFKNRLSKKSVCKNRLSKNPPEQSGFRRIILYQNLIFFLNTIIASTVTTAAQISTIPDSAKPAEKSPPKTSRTAFTAW